MKVFCITAGIGMILFSLIACGVLLIAIVDPVATQMADDNNPYGPPPSRLYSVSALCVSLVVGAAGVYLVRRSLHPRQNTTKVI